MASQNGANFHIELTEIESKLRQLLLDVASYIDENEHAPAEDVTAIQVPQELAKEKIVLRWTGGWVRDKLLKVGSHDIDLAINKMTGEHFGLKMQEYLEIPGNAEKHGLIDKNDKSSTQDKSKKIAPGLHKIEANPEKSKNLETATTKIMGIDLDLVNLRKETYNEISRNPEMEFGTAEEDAMRRDATVNAMFYNLHTCEIEDFTMRGHDDMAAGIIRTPLEPMQTFKDDPLRVLRLIRFASRLDYTIEPDTAQAMANPKIQSVLKVKISRERVGIELEKMLRGPRPRMALELIDRYGLYRTVFTDPTRQLPSEPETQYFQQAYEFVDSTLNVASQDNSSNLGMLTRTDEEKYLAWISAAMMPWADAPTVPHPKPTQRPFYTAYLVAREGFKAPNKICDVVSSSLSNGEEIRKIVAQCAKGLRRPDTVKTMEVNPTARDTLGMALRRWGPTWRTQVLFNLTYEVVVASLSRQELLKSYSDFLAHLAKLNILEVDTFKPLLKGTDLAKALNVKPGPWMKDALDMVMAWQLRNPDSTDTSAAIEAVKASRNGHTDSELPLRLAHHFIQLTIPPFFPQSKSTTSLTDTPRQPSPWKDASGQHAIDLLEWSIASLNRKNIETNWRYLVPPILKMLDDMDSMWKVKGCQLLQLLLKSFEERSQTKTMTTGSNKDSNFLQRTGYHSVFSDTLFPLLNYLPPLTPEAESRVLTQEALLAVTCLADFSPAEGATGDARVKFLDRIMREGVIAPLGHFSTPSTYPDLAMVMIKHMQVLLREMQIESVKHLPSILALLSSILHEPFVLSHEGLVLCTLQGLREVMLNTWPRIPGHRGQIMMGLSAAWIRCGEEGHAASDSNDEVKSEVQETVAMLDTVMQAVEDQDLRTLWGKEKAELIEASAACKSLFSACS